MRKALGPPPTTTSAAGRGALGPAGAHGGRRGDGRWQLRPDLAWSGGARREWYRAHEAGPKRVEGRGPRAKGRGPRDEGRVDEPAEPTDRVRRASRGRPLERRSRGSRPPRPGGAPVTVPRPRTHRVG